MDKKELIKKLRENARLNLDIPYDYNRGCGYGYENARLLVEQLEPDKVEVNEEQARFLKKYESEPLLSLICACSEKEEELLARARLCGYTVEQPKRLVVKANNFGIYFTMFRPETLSGIFGTKKCARTFTDRKKAEAVATLIDGSVEEV